LSGVIRVFNTPSACGGVIDFARPTVNESRKAGLCVLGVLNEFSLLNRLLVTLQEFDHVSVMVS